LNVVSIRASDQLTPSEFVLLNGDKFAGRSKFTNVKLPHKDAKVAIDHLLIAMLAAAVLANEQVGVLALKVGEKKVLGRQRSTVYAHLVNPNADWPEYSLEAEIRKQAESLLVDSGREAYVLIHGWLAHDSRSPWRRGFEKVRGNLVSRELLQKIETRRFRVFTKTEYALSPYAVELFNPQQKELTKKLLADCERHRPQLWKLLLDQIDYGFVRRTETARRY
jgi:hypothetical protein